MNDVTRSPSSRLALVVGLTAGTILLFLVAAAILLVAAADARLQNAEYEVAIAHIAPNAACTATVADTGKKVVRGLFDIATDILGGPTDSPPLPDAGDGGTADSEPAVDVADAGDDSDLARDPEGGPLADPDDQADDSPPGADEDEPLQQACRVTVTIEVSVENPLPIPISMRASIADVTIAGRPVDDDNIVVEGTHGNQVDIPAATTGTLVVDIDFDATHLTSAAAGLILRRQVEIEAQANIEIESLAGLVSRDATLDINESFGVSEILRGLGGTVPR